MNANKTFNKQIKPFNFMLIGSEKNGIIPCLSYNKDITGTQYKPFIDYKTDTASDKLPLPSYKYWYSLEDVLTKYVIHNDNKFDYNNEGIAHRKHIINDRIRYIGKESNNLEDNLTGLDDPDYLEYDNIEDFKQWILSLKPKDVRDKGISERGLRNFKQKIKNDKGLKNKSKIVRILFEYYKSKSTEQ